MYGQSVGTARRAGATPEQQAAYGLTSAAIEVASEMLFDGVAKIYGAGAADDIVEKLVVELAESDTGRSMLRFLALAAGEGMEEVVSDLLSPLAEATYRDESLAELYRQLEPSELLYDYLIGAAISTLASGASAATGQRAEASPEYRANEAEYFNILERNGHLESKNAAHEGAAMQEQDDTARKSSHQENGGLHYDETKSIIKKGKVSGALTPGSIRAEQHAEQYYESVRHMTTDVKRIAENTGFSEQEILEIKSFIFEETHDLGYDEPIRFFPSYEMAQSWQRLIDGKNIKPHDITLLYHELLERQLMLEGLSQEEAHIKASKEFNYNTEADEYYGSLEKYPKD